MKIVMKVASLKLMISILKIYIIFIMIWPLLPERTKIETVGKLVANLHDKKDMLCA